MPDIKDKLLHLCSRSTWGPSIVDCSCGFRGVLLHFYLFYLLLLLFSWAPGAADILISLFSIFLWLCDNFILSAQSSPKYPRVSICFRIVVLKLRISLLQSPTRVAFRTISFILSDRVPPHSLNKETESYFGFHRRVCHHSAFDFGHDTISLGFVADKNRDANLGRKHRCWWTVNYP